MSENVSLKLLNTFGVEVKARKFALINSVNDLQEISDLFTPENQVLILGSGSNILFTKDYNGLILKNKLAGKTIISETEEEVFLNVSGGEDWSELVDFTVEKGWGGIENLSLIPGTVGAAPVQNIGAYGVELKDALIGLEAFDLQSAEIHQFANVDCEFGYRSSIFKTKLKGRFFILNILLRLSKKPVLKLDYAPLKKMFNEREVEEVSVKEVSEAVKQIRRSKLPDPGEIGNAGSFFKNPVVPFSKIEELIIEFPEMPFYKVDDENYKIAAGWLIEKSGWKGKRFGDAGVHEKQALVLVNYGGATGSEIHELSQEIVFVIKSKFGINLECEVTVL